MSCVMAFMPARSSVSAGTIARTSSGSSGSGGSIFGGSAPGWALYSNGSAPWASTRAKRASPTAFPMGSTNSIHSARSRCWVEA